jgi:hypothetical protein
MAIYLPAMTDVLPSRLNLLLHQPVPALKVNLHVMYIHEGARIYKEYELPLTELPVQTFAERLEALQSLFYHWQSVLDGLHEELLKAPMFALLDGAVRERCKLPGDRFQSVHARVYRIGTRYTEVEKRPHRLLGHAYILDHVDFKEEAMVWIAPAGIRQTMCMSEWMLKLFGVPCRIDCDAEQFLKEVSR